MTEPLLTVRDLSVELKDDAGETELLRNYEFNISQGIVQRVSRFFDALALMDERGEAPPARGEGGKHADSARGDVMGFGRKRNVGNQEKKPARRVAWEQQKKERSQKEAEEAAAAAALKAAEQDTKLAALEVKVAAAAAREAAEQSAEVAALKAQVAAAAALKAAEQEKMAALKEEVAALKAAEQDTKIAALKAQVAEMQALVALRPIYVELPSPPTCTPAHLLYLQAIEQRAKEQRAKQREEVTHANLRIFRTPPSAPSAPSAPYTPPDPPHLTLIASSHLMHPCTLHPRTLHAICAFPMHPCPTCVLRRSWLRGGGSRVARLNHGRLRHRGSWPPSLACAADA